MPQSGPALRAEPSCVDNSHGSSSDLGFAGAWASVGEREHMEKPGGAEGLEENR